MDYYWKETLEKFNFYYEKYFGIDKNDGGIIEVIKDGLLQIEEEDINSKDAQEKGYFGYMDYYWKETIEKFNFYYEKYFGIDNNNDGIIEEVIKDGLLQIDEEDVNSKDAQEKGYFGLGIKLRDPKPPNVIFSVGDVVYHKTLKYKGVIVGWDEKENAPEKWLKAVRGSITDRGESQPNYAVLIDTRSRLTPQMENAPEKWLKAVRGSKTERGESQPNYAVLIDTRTRLTPQMGYVVQNNLELSQGRVFHPMIDKYFEGMETNNKYKIRPFVKEVYPND
uniref:Hemimethylated DNA-binding domain-containing protein n=1 Tax=Panagrolaimus sp. JU765 TaxID=591449 RepID=A0AC34QRB3_9BILA